MEYKDYYATIGVEKDATQAEQNGGDNAMETNVGVVDGFVRLAIGALLLAWSGGEFGLTPPPFGSWFIWILGLGLVLTWLFHHCVFYRILGTNSCAHSPGGAGNQSDI